MRKPLITLLLIVAASALGACGRDDNQEAVGSAMPTGKSATAPAGDQVGGQMEAPLQTGEAAKEGGKMPDGTETGARTTPNPQ